MLINQKVVGDKLRVKTGLDMASYGCPGNGDLVKHVLINHWKVITCTGNVADLTVFATCINVIQELCFAYEASPSAFRISALSCDIFVLTKLCIKTTLHVLMEYDRNGHTNFVCMHACKHKANRKTTLAQF